MTPQTGRPTSIAELIPFLQAHPMLSVSREGSARRHATFERWDRGMLWYRYADDQAGMVPLFCRAHGDETGVTFRDDGFVVEKFGVAITFKYDPAPVGFPAP